MNTLKFLLAIQNLPHHEKTVLLKAAVYRNNPTSDEQAQISNELKQEFGDGSAADEEIPGSMGNDQKATQEQNCGDTAE